jgi:hypothetical protein
MFSCLTSKRQKVIAAAADEDQSLRTSMAKDLFIGCDDWQHRTVTLGVARLEYFEAKPRLFCGLFFLVVCFQRLAPSLLASILLSALAGLIIAFMSPVRFTPEKECYTVLIL